MNDLTRNLQFFEDSHTYKVNGVVLPSVTEIIAPITSKKYAVSSTLVEQAAFRGSMIHELCAGYDYGETEDDVNVDVAGYLKAWSDFCHDYQPKWEFIEFSLACEDFAGTVDRVGIIDNERVIVDIKTTSGMDRTSKLSLASQIIGYERLCTANGIPCVHGFNSMGVHLMKDGTYKAYKVKDIEQFYKVNPVELFEKCLEIHRLSKGEPKWKEKN